MKKDIPFNGIRQFTLMDCGMCVNVNGFIMCRTARTSRTRNKLTGMIRF